MAKKKEQHTEENHNSTKFDKFKSLITDILGKNNGIVDDPSNIEIEKFPTGSYLLDRDLKGGWAKGTLVEIFGDPGCGKTTLAIHAVAEHMKKYPDEPVLWLDLEKVFDPTYFNIIGIDVKSPNFILTRPTAGEDAWETIITFVKEFKKGIVVLDSVALLLPIKEDENLMSDSNTMAGAARMNSQALRKLFPYMEMGGVTVLAINQVRSNIGVMYGDTSTTTGGKGLSFYSRTRIKVSKSKGEVGEYTNNKFTQVKSNYGLQDKVTETSIVYGKGFDKDKELVLLATEAGVLTKKGAFYSYEGVNIGQGLDRTLEALSDNPELKDEILNRLRDEKII